jgi:hypothetical protein
MLLSGVEEPPFVMLFHRCVAALLNNRSTSTTTNNHTRQDSVKYTKPTPMTAPEYIDILFEWAESQLNDENIFPIQFGQQFPKDFKKRVSTLFKRFFRVYAHIYHSHLSDIEKLGADAHLNTCFKHFMFFVLEFQVRLAAESNFFSFRFCFLRRSRLEYVVASLAVRHRSLRQVCRVIYSHPHPLFSPLPLCSFRLL